MTEVKCPVCKTELTNDIQKCTTCGFSKLHIEFVTTQDAERWVERVVVPYRIEWQRTLRTADEIFFDVAAQQLSEITQNQDPLELFDYDIDFDGIVITEYRGNSSHVIIPDRIDGIKVYKLGADLFRNCSELLSVQLPSQLRIIEDRAFLRTGLTQIKFPPKLESIGKLAFSNTKLDCVEFPSSLRSIGWRAFCFDYFSHGLHSVKFNDGIETIANEAFMNTKIKEVIFPKSLSTISRSVCKNCLELKTVVVLGATTIEEEAFADCKSLEKVSLCDGLLEIKSRAFGNCNILKRIILPSTVQRVDSSAILYSGYNHESERHIAILNDDIKISGSGWKKNVIFCRIGSSAHRFGREKDIIVRPLNEFLL